VRDHSSSLLPKLMNYGVFEFDVFVHDTDTITLAAHKPGYGPAERRIVGVDCFGSCPPVDLVLPESATP
jgi:hypothetical protein